MLPNVYGWSWTPGHVIFVSVFFIVALTIGTTVLIAWWRAQRDLTAGRADTIRWEEDFHDLSPAERTCRHVITKEFKARQCDKAFDCRECPTHAKLVPATRAADIYYHRGHTWVRPEADGALSVGLDDLAMRLLGAGADLDLPATGTRVHVHSPAVWAHRDGHDVRILSPVEGEVIPGNGTALFRVRPSETPVRFTHLLSGDEAELWKCREWERLQMLLAPDARLASLADGGVAAADLPGLQPKADWSRIWGAMLLEP